MRVEGDFLFCFFVGEFPHVYELVHPSAGNVFSVGTELRPE